MKKFRAFFVVIILFMAFFQAEKTSGQIYPKDYTPAANTVQYMGVKDNFLVFKVNLERVKKGSLLSILDENDQELFSERIEKTALVKIFKFEKDGFSKLQFRVRGKQQEMNETFSLKYKIEEKFEVVKA